MSSLPETTALLLQKGKQSSLPEFFLAFFQRKYGDMPAFDWTYSIYENIKLYRSNEAMALFYDIVTGNVSSPLYSFPFLRRAE